MARIRDTIEDIKYKLETKDKKVTRWIIPGAFIFVIVVIVVSSKISAWLNGINEKTITYSPLRLFSTLDSIEEDQTIELIDAKAFVKSEVSLSKLIPVTLFTENAYIECASNIYDLVSNISDMKEEGNQTIFVPACAKHIDTKNLDMINIEIYGWNKSYEKNNGDKILESYIFWTFDNQFIYIHWNNKKSEIFDAFSTVDLVGLTGKLNPN